MNAGYSFGVMVAAFGLVVSASAQTSPANVIERFVAAVQGGANFAGTEFAGVVKAEDATKLAALAKCIPGPPRTSDSDSAIMVLWDCSAQPGVRSAAMIFDVQDGRITSFYMMPAVVVPARAQ